jgi:tetratricopeptide (TPR) repeat protein
LAGSLIAVADFQRALAANKRAFSIRPDEILVISQMALNYFYLHDLSEARRLFQRVLAKDPAAPVEPQLYLVHIALAERNKDEAAHYIKEFLSVHPNAPQAENLKDTLARLDSVIFTPVEITPTKQ